jgi:hypothetical protein
MITTELLDITEKTVFKSGVKFGVKKLFDATTSVILEQFIDEMHAAITRTAQILRDQNNIRVAPRILLDGYLSTVFWHLVLNRPFVLPVTMGRKDKSYSLLTAFEEPDIAGELHNLDLGVSWDRTNNLLTLVWNEAIMPGLGILSGWENCLTWKKVQSWFAEGRIAGGGLSCDQLQRLAALSSTQAITGDMARKLGNLKHSVGYLDGVSYNDIVMFNLHAARVIEKTVSSYGLDVGQPAPLRTNFCRFYSPDRSKWALEKAIEQDALNKRIFVSDSKRAAIKKKERERRQAERDKLFDPDWCEASQLIQKIPALLGLTKLSRGRPRARLSKQQSKAIVLATVTAYINGLGQPVQKWMTAHLAEVLRRLNAVVKRKPEIADIAYQWLTLESCDMKLETWVGNILQEQAGGADGPASY